MRVGIHVASSLAQEGGGFTFESEILQAVLQLRDLTNHEFVLFAPDAIVPLTMDIDATVPYVSLHQTTQEKLIFSATRLQRALAKKIKNPNKPWRVEHWQEFIRPQLLKHRIDLVWSLSPWFLSLEVPYITTVWDLQHRLQPFFPELQVNDSWYAREDNYENLLRRAAVILTGTEVGKAEIQLFYQIPAERIQVVPMPTPGFALSGTHQTGINVLEKYQIPDHYLFYPAQFWPHKNHANLLLALKFLIDHHQLHIPLVLAGTDKENLSYVQNLVVELGLREQVFFLGFVPQEDLIELYKHAFALTFVSFFGPDNLPPLEAFALGCPVIAAQVSGAEEQLGDAAFLVDPTSIEAIARAIKTLTDQPEKRQSLIHLGRQRAKQWTCHDYAKSVFPILDDFAAIRRCWP
jgi:glycosyltransferase involved in cell wall biosynthesis